MEKQEKQQKSKSQENESEGKGNSASPPAFSVSTSPVPPPNNNNPLQAAGGIFDGIADALNMRENEAELDLQEDIADFESRNYGPMTYTRPNIGGSGFEASYSPPRKKLDVEVRTKVRFAPGLLAEGGTVRSPNSFMNREQIVTVLNTFPALQAQILPFYQWGGDERAIHLQRFRDNISSTMNVWQNTGMHMQVAETGWENVTATPNINIRMSEGTAVHAQESYGPLGLFTRTDDTGSDHLQVEIVKKPSTADAAAINNIIRTHMTNFFNGLPMGIGAGMVGSIPNDFGARGVRSYLGTDPSARGGAPNAFNNFMSLESDRSDDPNDRVFEHTVHFEDGETDLSLSEWFRLYQFVSNPSVLLQNPNGNVNVELRGFDSVPGTDAENRDRVSKRLQSVSQVINDKMDSRSVNISTHVNPATQHNDSDSQASLSQSFNPWHDPADFRRVDIKITHQGRGANRQNVLSHEFGHVFGLGDEYAETANGYNRPAGSNADHHDIATQAGVSGGAVVGSDNRMMSTGNLVNPAHYSTFADCLRQLTGKPWSVV